MKYSFKMLFMLLLTALTILGLQAQPPAEEPGPRRGMRNIDPEVRAERQAQHMAEVLQLDEDMQGELKAVLLVYARKMKETREGATDFAAARETLQNLRASLDEELQAMLTEAQWITWQANREERGPRRPGEQHNKAKKKKKDTGT